jgi:Polyketide cyclase / dehydrase and lipid transport
MVRVEGKGVVIDRSVDDVWRFMTDISNMPHWEENQADWKQTSEGPIDAGTTFQTISRPSIGRPFGWEVKTNLRITEFEPNRKFAIEATSGFLEGTKISYLMEPLESEKTRLSRVTEFRFHGLARLMRPFQAPLARRDGGVEVSGVKRILESQRGRDGS